MPRPSASKEGSTNKKGSQIAKAKDSKKPKAEKKGSATAKHKDSLKGSKTAAGSATKKVPTIEYKIDCSIPAADSIFDADLLKGFEQFLNERIKVKGRTGKLRDAVKVGIDGTSVSIKAFIAFSKKYLKFLTKKYLKKKTLRDWLRVVSTNKTTYELRYFNIHDQDEGEEE
uniref:Large ribosomal subunit protein eL22 n=1 Tax=Euglena gracilis TaxID=3039 RepID=A0A7L5NWK6_EUGGR|nr:60S large subunit ribosomal protein eL22 [Euglena gracilis]6ZJ3_Lj Chain Lj, Ribosomal protein eL22 [Euglena gracilis]